MGFSTVFLEVLLGAHLAYSLNVNLPKTPEARNAIHTRATDHLDEVVYLADCRKYKDKADNEKDIIAHVSFALYHENYDTTRTGSSFKWGAIADPSYPKGQRVDSMGGAFVDWTAAKQDDRIEANFKDIERRFWVHSLSRKGDPKTNATGIASLGDYDMRCYEDRTFNRGITYNDWHYRCSSTYACTRSQRRVRRTLFSFSEETVDVEILGRVPTKLKIPKDQRDPRVEGVISNVYYWLSTVDPKQGSVAEEFVIDTEFKRQFGKNMHSVRYNWKAGMISSDPTYDPNRIKLISTELSKRLNPEIEKKVKNDGLWYWDDDWILFKAPFPATIKVQIQTASQERLDWSSTDEIEIAIVDHKAAKCGNAAAWAKLLSGLFGGAAALATGGVSAALTGLGGVAGMIHTASCLSS